MCARACVCMFWRTRIRAECASPFRRRGPHAARFADILRCVCVQPESCGMERGQGHVLIRGVLPYGARWLQPVQALRCLGHDPACCVPDVCYRCLHRCRAYEHPGLERCNRDNPRGGLLEHRPEPVGVPFRPAVPHNHLDNGHAACLCRAGPRHGCAACSAHPALSWPLGHRWEVQAQI
jgi:hypothetical protein